MLEKNEELIQTKVLKDIDKKFTKEQKDIIKAPLDKNLLVQGVAGCGKSQLAFYRIAYQVYKNKFKQEEFRIFTQNKYFLSYISDIVSQLGLEKIKHQTFEDFAIAYIERKAKLTIPKDKIINKNINSNEDDLTIKTIEYKSSMEFKFAIDKYLEQLALKIIPQKDFILSNVRIIRAETVKDLFINTYSKLSFEERIDEIKKYIFEKINQNAYVIIKEIIAKRSVEVQQLMKKDLPIKKIRSLKNNIFEKTEKLLQMLYKEDIRVVDLYLGDINLENSKKYYQDFILNYAFNDIKDEELAKFLINSTNLSIERRDLYYEDLAALAYIHSRVFKNKDSNKLKLLVIDDAQDYGDFQLFVLKEVFNYESITMFGDLVQDVYSKRKMENYESFINDYFEKEKLDKKIINNSYRINNDAVEITNRVIRKLSNSAKFLLNTTNLQKENNKVKLIGMKNYDDVAREIARKIRHANEEYVSCAIIGKDLKECRKIRTALGNYITKPPLVEDTNLEYRNGVYIIPSYLAKGIEFEYVIIANMSSEIYSDNVLDKKLLYIALTRAKKKLDIYFIKNISNLIIE